MYLDLFLTDFMVFRVFLGISWDFAEIPEFRGSASILHFPVPHACSLLSVFCFSTALHVSDWTESSTRILLCILNMKIITLFHQLWKTECMNVNILPQITDNGPC